MTIFWPSELQQKPQVKGFQVTLADNAVRSPVDAGPPKARRRFTAAVRPVTASIFADNAARAVFETFYDDTTKSGTQNFVWAADVDDVAYFWMFSAPPTITPIGGIDWQIDMQLIRLARPPYVA